MSGFDHGAAPSWLGGNGFSYAFSKTNDICVALQARDVIMDYYEFLDEGCDSNSDKNKFICEYDCSVGKLDVSLGTR